MVGKIFAGQPVYEVDPTTGLPVAGAGGGVVTSDYSVNEDDPHTSGDALAGIAVRRKDTPASSAGTDGDYATLDADALGRVWVNFTAAGTRVEGTIAAGGTAQNAFSATPVNGWEIINTHTTETLFIRESGSAATAANNTFNIAIPPGQAYGTPTGYKPVSDVSIIAATTGHAFIARRW